MIHLQRGAYLEALGGSWARFVQLLTLAAARIGTTVRGKWGNVDERSILSLSHYSSSLPRSVQIERSNWKIRVSGSSPRYGRAKHLGNIRGVEVSSSICFLRYIRR